MKNIYFYNTRIGRIAIADNGRAIVRLAFVKGDGTGTAVRQVKDDTGSWQAENGETFAVRETPLIKEATGQLNEYLEGNRRVFDIPLDLDGTPFQKAVWDALLEIPYGETRSYGEIAERIGTRKPQGQSVWRTTGTLPPYSSPVTVSSARTAVGWIRQWCGYKGKLLT